MDRKLLYHFCILQKPFDVWNTEIILLIAINMHGKIWKIKNTCIFDNMCIIYTTVYKAHKNQRFRNIYYVNCKIQNMATFMHG